MNTLYNEYLEEIDSAISESLDRKDINSKMYKLKSLVTGPNIKPQEKAAINRNSRIAFKLFEAIVIPALLNNCASCWY